MTDSQKHVTVNRIFPATIDRLWDAFTNPDDMLKWHSPEGMKNPKVEVDLRVGGLYAITMEYDESGEQVTVRGVYKIIEKPRMLVYSWKWDGSDEETEVRVLFRAVSNVETEVELTHSGFNLHPAAIDVANNWTHESHKQGWTSAFGKLASLLETK
ncbi:MAG: hypothetical protein RLZZ455_1042 [Candidatus Parcubacteria bacterium]|jgi:uncharacterized protein YndB with AHSA1/START domain